MSRPKNKEPDRSRRRREISRDSYYDAKAPYEVIEGLTYTGYNRSKGMPVRTHHYFRPKIEDPGVLDAVCEELVMGKGLYKICEDKNFPTLRNIYGTIARNPDGSVARRIMQARDQQQDAIMDLIRSLGDQMNDANYSAMSARIRNLQWLAAKLAPKRYGDKADPLMIDNRQQVVINITQNNYEEISQRLLTDV